MDQKQKMTFQLRSERMSHAESISFCETPGKTAKISLDTNLAGNPHSLHGARQDVPLKMESIHYEQ